MPFANYIYEYFSGIQTGKYTVGKWVRLIYEIVIAGGYLCAAPSGRLALAVLRISRLFPQK